MRKEQRQEQESYLIEHNALAEIWVVIHRLYDSDGNYCDLEIDRFDNQEAARVYKDLLEGVSSGV